tara:strand:- start:465 stop:701 length:237 start_codon:yes stop_codon:yes gene_type:complete
MNWNEEEKKMNEAIKQLTQAFSGLVKENLKLRKMNAELYDHASDDMELEQLRKLNKQLFTLAGMPSEVGFADEKKVEK